MMSEPILLIGEARRAAEVAIRICHYTQSVPSGKSYYMAFGRALVVWSLPANPYAGRHFLRGLEGPRLLELTRLWAPDGHEKNLLSQAISETMSLLRQLEPDLDLLISYADPNASHKGGVYRAANWIYCGVSEEGRFWRHKETGLMLPRRAFHSGKNHINKKEIEELGYVQVTAPGKHRFAFPLSRRAKRLYAKMRADDLKKRQQERSVKDIQSFGEFLANFD